MSIDDGYYAAAPTPAVPPPAPAEVVQAGFLRRWAAYFLDGLILSAAFYALFFIAILVFGVLGRFDALNGFDREEPPAWFVSAYLGLYVLYFILAGLYFSLMESSSNQASVGKMALGIKVVDSQGTRLTFGHALGRWFSAALSYLTLYIGFFIAGFTERKQALHDLVVGTYVVDKWAYTEHPERQQRGLSGCLIAFLVVVVLFGGIAVLGIVAAIALPAYHDYTARAHASGATAVASTLKAEVAKSFQASGECPTNASDGFGAPDSYATPGVARVVIGPIDDYEDGGCGLVIWMPPATGSYEENHLTYEYLTEQGTWFCTSSLPDKQLPADCR